MVHLYKLNGYNIVLDMASGSVHSVDEVAYDAISLYEEKQKDEIKAFLLEKYADNPDVTSDEIDELFSDIDALISAGKLFSKDIYEGHAFDFKNRHTDVKALCLHIAHSCNLTCDYCFAAQGNFHGKSALMSFEVGKRAIDFLIENSGKRKNLEVDFFGGEPLLNFDVVKKIVAYARSVEKAHNKNFRFTLTTNGMLIDDDVIEFANRECHNVVLSLDGRKEIHDALRKTPSGEGSYDTIVPKFKKLVESRGGTGYYIRGTFTHRNPDFTNDVLHMADLGFRELSMEPVVCAPDDVNALTDEDINIVCEQYEVLAKEIDNRNPGLFLFHRA